MLFSIREQDYQGTLARLHPESFGSDSGSYLLAKAILYERAQEGPSAQVYFDSARAYLEPRVTLSPGDSRLHAQLGLALAGLGRAGAAVWEGRRAVELLPISEDAYAGAALVDNLAHIYVMVGDYDAAIDELEALLSADAPVSVPWLLADPTWDPLRDNPRFESLIEAG
ncbi:MAG: hypothetical protein AMS25_14020 [Gemmatimonas sp. SM23_52]|nr:MAG: hypothetical protein AMS25_14020 [Gemmatimonas sp. SM23_52]